MNTLRDRFVAVVAASVDALAAGHKTSFALVRRSQKENGETLVREVWIQVIRLTPFFVLPLAHSSHFDGLQARFDCVQLHRNGK